MLFFVVFSLAAFCQMVPDSTVKADLESLGLSSTVTWLIVTALGLLLGQVAVPNKFAGVLFYIQKIIKYLHDFVGWINDKTNNGQVKNFYKKTVTILVFGFIIGGLCQAQAPFKGFFKPVGQNQVFKTQKAIFGGESKGVWLFRPSVTLTALAIDLKQSNPISQSLSSVGTGVSYGNFSTVDNKPYCNYSVNALFLTQVKLGEQTVTTFGAAVTVDVFNKFIGLGVGYINKDPMIMTTISTSF